MSGKDLRAEALKLRPKARAKLARELLVSLDGLSSSDLERLWIEEALRRDEELDSGKARLRPAADVLKRAQARLV
ncbi:MAG: addiction module protein [Planctomycetes bacterium]|nr:addiction module protein [Planctomycetota bacterium]